MMSYIQTLEMARLHKVQLVLHPEMTEKVDVAESLELM
jgi:hypothetical protein